MSNPDADRYPMVGIIVVNYFGGRTTLACLASIERCTWPHQRLRVALVDNGSDAGFGEQVRTQFPAVRMVESAFNLGFGGGCNKGLEVLDDCSFIGLLNNDATPEPGWIEPLVDVLLHNPRAGAATPQVLLEGQFLSLRLTAPTVRPGSGDSRSLGVQLCGVRVNGSEVLDRIELVRGFWGWEQDEISVGGRFAWTSGDAEALIPLPRGDDVAVEVRLAAGTGPTRAELVVGEVHRQVDVGVLPTWHELGATPAAVDVVNNLGLELRKDGSCADRGYLGPVTASAQTPAEVFGWSGAAVLLPKAFFDDVGTFDDRYFLYYEDADLSWRGRLRGWSFFYVPRSIVRHQHSATVGSHTSFIRHLSERNRLLMLSKCAPGELVRRELTRASTALCRTLLRDVVARSVRRRRPVLSPTRDQARVLAGFVRMLPGTLEQRRLVRRGATVPDVEILAFAEDFEGLAPSRRRWGSNRTAGRGTNSSAG